LPLGQSTRIATARQVLRDVLGKIPDDFNVGLRVYANRYSARQKETCTDTSLVSTIAKVDRQRILSIADRLQPRGETPLVYSILQIEWRLRPAGSCLPACTSSLHNVPISRSRRRWRAGRSHLGCGA
jgi:hypothetical protein